MLVREFVSELSGLVEFEVENSEGKALFPKEGKPAYWSDYKEIRDLEIKEVGMNQVNHMLVIRTK